MTGQIIFQGSGRSLRKLPDRMYKTYQVASPLDTHWRPATCEEYGCEAFAQGWTYKKSDLIAADLYYLVTHAGKRYREMSLADDSEIYVVFEPGQPCFQAKMHRISLERPEIFLAGRGAGKLYNPRKANQFDNAEDWAESFAEHQDIIKSVVEGGL